MNRNTIECAISALRVIRDSLDEPSQHYSRERQQQGQAEIDAALYELKNFPAPPQPDWGQAPEWAEWWAVDPNGWAHWFEAEPLLALTINYSGWVPKTINGVQQGMELWAAEYDLALGVDWRTLTQQRPQVIS